MSVYRVLKALDTGHVPGDILDGRMFKALDKLVAAGALIKARTPPLAELPGWTARAETLREIGVVTVDDLLDLDPQRGTELFNHKRNSTFIRWIDEAKGWLLTPEPKKGCCK
jgi:hypothetical protein